MIQPLKRFFTLHGMLPLILILFVCVFSGAMFLIIQSKQYDKIVTYSGRYLNETLSNEERVNDLLSQMTLSEKIGQMALVEKNSVRKSGDVSEYGIGGILSGAGGKPDANTVEGWRDMVTKFEQLSRESRLGIPVLYGVDANHGHGNVPAATIFPHFIGLGASGDEDLVAEVARATGEELVATGINWSYSPTLDLPEDIRWGRVYETFSSDPNLVARLGSAYIRGIQNDDVGHVPVLATAKHFIGAGSMGWESSSNKNFLIDQGKIEVDEVKLREIYLPPFAAAVDAGVGSVMVGLQSWGTTKLSAEKYLITDVLKGELGFDGFVVSDWYSVYEISNFDFYSSVVAINAGVDMIMLPFEYETFVRNVSWAVKLRLISEERIDDAVRRILRAKFKLGLFDERKSAPELDVIGSEAHRKLARDAVSQSLVLLKNDSQVLPLKNVRSIHVAGSSAHNIGRQMGAWTIEWQGVDGNWVPGATSILDGIEEVSEEGTTILFAEDGIFEEGSRADVGIAVVGEAPYAEGWGDDPRPKLSDVDLSAIEELRKTSERLVVVLVTGRPLIITNELPDWDALVVAWLPGSEGAGVADGLFGKRPFTGTLPIHWPAIIKQVPVSTDGKTTDGTDLLFERDFGL